MLKTRDLRGVWLALALLLVLPAAARAAEDGAGRTGGGYAVTGQLEGVGYAAELFDAGNGLPTSDANCILSASDGYIWIGGYSGIIRYDGNSFERLDSSDGLTSGRAMLEDRQGRIWVGTNDNGVVVMDGGERRRFTYEDGLPSSSVRTFEEAPDGTVYIGTAVGVCYVGEDMVLHKLDDERINAHNIERLVADSRGRIYGSTWDGDVFCIESERIVAFYSDAELGIDSVTAIYADAEKGDVVYFGTDSGEIYRGVFGNDVSKLRKLSVSLHSGVTWITRACGRIWICSQTAAGYLDESDRLCLLENVPLNNSIEMLIPDYQGNLWLASSRQGVMKVVPSHFQNVTELASLPAGVVNSTCLHGKLLYIGTDQGLQIVGEGNRPIENELTEYIGSARIRCITADGEGNLWISTVDGTRGLVCYTPEHGIISYTMANGMTSNQVRCTVVAADGSIIAGTNDGLSVLRGGRVVRTVGTESGIQNTVFLTVEEGDAGTIYVGTDGDGMYAVRPDGVERIGRGEGLTSDVVMRIKRDDRYGVYWIVTSNSIEYMRDGKITNVSAFPYNNNFDVYFSGDNIWILSSYGIYCVRAEDMLSGEAFDYSLYNMANGLPSIPTANSFSALDEDGNLYIAGRSGVSKVNIDHFFDQPEKILVGVRSIFCGETEIRPGAGGVYTIPSDAGRIQIRAAVLDYTLLNPTIRLFLEGSDDPGVTAPQDRLTPLEFTGLAYGSYTLHVQVLDRIDGSVYQDEIFSVVKQPRMIELLAVRILLLALLALLAGLVVWRVMTNTVIRRQYEEIRRARDEAEQANDAKSRFLANISHEIRTPINTIMGMDEMILREDAADVPKGYFMSVVNYALDIRNASQALLELVNDLLDISKIESGRMYLVEQDYDVAELLRSVVAMIRVRSAQKGLSFDVDIDGSLPKRLYGDAGKLKQILLNLLTNAVKYTEKGGFTLRVAVTEKTETNCRLRISVKDTGIGVKPEDMDKLFTAYERLDEKKNSGIQGTGLGLDISRQFAELMDGRLWCESVYGEGSEFILTLEQKVTDTEELGTFYEAGEETARGPYVPQFVAPDADVLVVDDNPMNLTVIKGLLKATKMFITTAESGEECLEKLKYGHFNVVLLDHMMPGMDGVETLAEIRKSYPDLPVYALTANAVAGGEKFYRSKGFDGYLTKPIDSVALERAIMRHLPEEIMMKPSPDGVGGEPEQLPEEMAWIGETEGISVPDGVRYSGGVKQFLSALELFLDTIDGNAAVLENAFDSGDVRLFTVKVHALKTSARIIGSQELSTLAEQLENAGTRGDEKFIRANIGRLLEMYRAYRTKLARLREKDAAPDREPIPADELASGWAALREAVPQMDYDSVELIVQQLKAYRLPEADDGKLRELERLLKTLDWDGMEKLVG